MDSLIIKASDILSELMVQPVSADVLKTESLRRIDINTASDQVAYFYKDVKILEEALLNHFNKKGPQFPEDKLKVAYAILKFLSSPKDFCKPTEINLQDPTNEMLKRTLVRLGVSYIRNAIDTYKVDRQNLQSKKKRSGTLLY